MPDRLLGDREVHARKALMQTLSPMMPEEMMRARMLSSDWAVTVVAATTVVFSIVAARCQAADATFSVENAVEAEWYVDVAHATPVLGDDGEKSLEAITYSPDGGRAAFVTRQGNLTTGETEYELHVAHLSGGNVAHKALVQLSARSDRPSISEVRWISNDTIAFLGLDKDGITQQVMSVDLQGNLKQLTKGTGYKLGFDTGDNGTSVYGVVLPDAPAEAERDAGYVVDGQTLADIVGSEKIDWRRPTAYYVSDGRHTRRLEGQLNATSAVPPFISISSSGRYVVMATGPSHVPEEWATFPLLVKAIAGAAVHPYHAKLTLFDLNTNRRYELSGAPMAYPINQTQVVWDEGNDRLFLIDQFLSAKQAASLDGVTHELLPATFEFSLATMRPARLIDSSAAPQLYANEHTADAAQFNEKAGTLEIARGGRLIRYEETPAGWHRQHGSAGEELVPERPLTLEVHQTVTEPAQMYAYIGGRNDPVPVGKINEHLEQKFNPARLYRWTDEAGRKWQGGLILPKGAPEGQALPLIIQTHSFSAHEFVITGTRGSSAGFSAQALASAGFAVLNVGRQSREVVSTDQEFEIQSEGFRSAIFALTAEGVVDPARVGIIAWSRSGFWLQHALGFQDELFAAAIAADASSFGKWSYLFFHNWPSGFQGDYLKQNSVPPFGEGLDRWRNSDPVTHVDAFTTPLLIENYGHSFPSWWEPYVAMKVAGEAVEFFILPDAPHDPIQPLQRFRVQTMTLDWFRFWLQGYEDPDPDKAKQYARWRTLRAAHIALE